MQSKQCGFGIDPPPHRAICRGRGLSRSLKNSVGSPSDSSPPTPNLASRHLAKHMSESRRVIYVAGLGHSGSTLLDLLLGTGRKAVSLGQIWTVLREDPLKSRARVCTCGAEAPDCPLWGPILQRLGAAAGALSEAERYRIVLARVKDLYGPQMAIVDSSKQVANFAILSKELPELQLLVLHNIKDVRAFTISMIDNAVRRKSAVASPERIFLEWYRANRAAHLEVCKAQGRPPFRLTYEAICFATQTVADRTAEYLGEPYIEPGTPLKGRRHIISGNRFRLSESAATNIAYDCRWFGRSEWLRPYVLMPMIRKYNEKCLREWSALSPADA